MYLYKAVIAMLDTRRPIGQHVGREHDRSTQVQVPPWLCQETGSSLMGQHVLVHL